MKNILLFLIIIFAFGISNINVNAAFAFQPDSTLIESEVVASDENEEESEVEEIDESSQIEENEVETNYINFTPYMQYKTQQIQNGVYLSNGNPALSFGIDMFNSWGFSLGFGQSNLISNGFEYLNNTLNIGYEYEFSSFFSSELSYSKTFYQTNTTSTKNEELKKLSEASNNISLSFDLILPHFIIDLAYSERFGNNTFRNLGLTMISYFKIGEKLKITPIASVVATNYKINLTKLDKIYKNTGLSNISATLKFAYEIIDNLNVAIVPTLAYTPMKELSLNKYNTSLSLNLDYSFDLEY